jgi:tRNA threonylcarbamoyladenosine biosynthesis protein TsaE
MKTLTINSLSDIERAAKEFLMLAGNKKIFAFIGTMGAGKTTFIKAICKILGVSDEVNSPTFSIINEYTAQNNELVYHFDFYRINKLSEAQDLGLDDYFYSNNFCFMEWAELIAPLLPSFATTVTITENPDQTRTIRIPEN